MNKRLGQHFLVNKEKINKIVEVLEIKDCDTIIEIGPGHGEVTHKLLAVSFELLEKDERGIKIIAVEKDKAFAEQLKKTFAGDKNIQIISGDALEILPLLTKNSKPKAKSYKLVGNIPYYITGRLLRILSELQNKPEIIVLTVQKEVAERICAKPKKGRSASNGMNLLAASVQFWADPEIVGFISKNDFQPKPKVDSAIVKFEIRNSRPTSPGRSPGGRAKFEIQDSYYKMVRILFKQPRKTVLNNLRSFYPKEKILENLNKLNINPAARPQNLSIQEIIEISKI